MCQNNLLRRDGLRNKKEVYGSWLFVFAFNSTGTPQIGDNIVVVSNTWGTLDKDNEGLGDALGAGDALGVYEQTSSGKAKYIWKGAHGKVIHGSWTQVQVRFDDGTLYWVPTDAVKKD